MSRIQGKIASLLRGKAKNVAKTVQRQANIAPQQRAIKAEGAQPYIFATLRNGALIQFNGLKAGRGRLAMRIIDEAPITLVGRIEYLAPMGTVIASDDITLAPSEPLKRINPEEKIAARQAGDAYRLVGSYVAPRGAVSAVLKLPPTPDRAPLFVTQSIRLAFNNQKDIMHHATHLYQSVTPEKDSERIILLLKRSPAKDINFMSVLMSDMIGTGPGVLRMQRYTRDGDLIPAAEFEACGRDGALLHAIPRVRKLASPGRGLKTMTVGNKRPLIMDSTISMIRENTTGSIDLLSTVMRMNKSLTFGPRRLALNDIAGTYFRDAAQESDEDLVKLLY